MNAGKPQTGGDGTWGPGLARASFGLQVVLIGIVALYDCLLIDDAFFAPAGRPDVLMRWRGSVWPALILLSVWAAHIWLARALLAPNRRSTRPQSALVYLLAATLLVCDVLSSSDAESWRARLGRRYPDPAPNALLVTILLEDPGTGRGTRTTFDLRSSSLVRSAGLQGDKLPVTDDYFVANRRLRVGSLDVGSADGILYQGRLRELAIVIVRVEHNSLSTPWRVLSALSGHVVQLDTIIALAVAPGAAVTPRVLAQAESSTRWKASVFMADQAP